MHKTGLALGGGAVLGAAHIGVLRAIEDHDMQIHNISGTSIGALVGALYAFGLHWKDIRKNATKINWMDIGGISLSRYGLLSNENLGEIIIRLIGDKNIEDADIPLSMIATDAASGEKVVLNKGSVSKAVMASTCIPGIFEPVEINGKMLLDGGIVENVPVKTSRDHGAEYVIGVDLNSHHKYSKPNNIIEVILNSFHFLIRQRDANHAAKSDLLITPELNNFNRTDMGQVNELVEQGYKASVKALKSNFEA